MPQTFCCILNAMDPQPTPATSDWTAEEPRARLGRANDIRATLQEEIETGKLPPGAVLDERALAARFEVSRTPVREALQQLAAREVGRGAQREALRVARL
jgi:DNA-binding GntR family transcriptional regulator